LGEHLLLQLLNGAHADPHDPSGLHDAGALREFLLGAVKQIGISNGAADFGLANFTARTGAVRRLSSPKQKLAERE